MKVIETPIKDLVIIEPRVFEDERGYFFESFNQQKLVEAGLDYSWVQDNQSFSDKGTLRGLHFQKGAFAQAKLVRVISGEVIDVAVDLRPDSETYGKSFSVILSGENFKQLLVPRGFAHGFCVLSETATFSYKVDNFYNQESEGGLMYSDDDLKIDWVLPASEIKLSEKDKYLSRFRDLSGENLWS